MSAHIMALGPSCVKLDPGFKMLRSGCQRMDQLAWEVKLEVEEVLQGGRSSKGLKGDLHVSE